MRLLHKFASWKFASVVAALLVVCAALVISVAAQTDSTTGEEPLRPIPDVTTVSPRLIPDIQPTPRLIPDLEPTPRSILESTGR